MNIDENWIAREKREIQVNQTKSNQIKPNQTKSNQRVDREKREKRKDGRWQNRFYFASFAFLSRFA
jgi:hypothetical protein